MAKNAVAGIGLGVLLVVSPAASEISFDPRLDLTTGLEPLVPVIQDIDGDGRADIAVAIYANGGGASFMVFRNLGDPGTLAFDAGVSFSTGAGPQGLALGDLDADGAPDAVTANADTNDVSVLRNSSAPGFVSFEPSLNLPGGHNPHRVVIAEIDGDGRPELVVTNNGGGSISFSVFRNTSSVGSMSFSPRVDFPVASNPNTLAVADIDGDGMRDVIVPSGRLNLVSVFRNTSAVGGVSFAARVDYATAPRPTNVGVADLDGDGKGDLVLQCRDDAVMSVFRNTSSPGTVAFGPRLDFASDAQDGGIGLEDLDNDGRVDVVLGNAPEDGASILRSTSTFGAISFVEDAVVTADDLPIALDVGDVDGDGLADFVVSNHWGSSLSVFRNATEQTITVAIDVKPGSDPNCFNINGHGVVPVAILGSPGLSVADIDPESLLFDGLAVRVRGNHRPQCSFEDSNSDGLEDLVCQFEDDPSFWVGGGATGTVSGGLIDGTQIEGSDSICVVP